MQTVQRLLGESAEPKIPYMLRPLQVGDIGWIIHRQGLLYAQEYGWDETYEALVAEILGAFVKSFDPKWERSWIAEREGEVVGSVFVVRKSDQVAKLRLLYVEPSARGLGIGKSGVLFKRSRTVKMPRSSRQLVVRTERPIWPCSSPGASHEGGLFLPGG